MLVVKVGGAQGIGEHLHHLAADLADVWASDRGLVLVHGGSAQADALGAKLGVPQHRIVSPSGHVARYSDRDTMDVMTMAVAGLLNKQLVRELQANGINALGLSGLDGGLLGGKRKEAIRSIEGAKVKVVRDDYSAVITRVNTGLLRGLSGMGYLPVVAPLVLSDNWEICNVDADRAAASVAVALGADALVVLTNVPGLLRDPADPASLVPRVRLADAASYLPLAAGRMLRKLEAALEAAGSGVSRVVIADARIDRPVTRAIAGEGTVVSP